MKVQEFIEYMGKSMNGTMKSEQIVALAKKRLEVKKYLSIQEKKDLVDKIIYNSVYYQDGISKIDAINCYMYFTMFTIDAYTNLEIDNAEDCYDALAESGLIDVVIASLGHEYEDVHVFLNMKRDEILTGDSIEAQFGKFFNNISNEVSGLKSTLIDAFNGLNIDKTDVIKLIKMIVQQ